MVARLIDAAFAVVYLHLLGRSDVGSYTFLVVFTTYLDTLIDFGFNALLAREIPRSPAIAASAARAVNVLRLGLWLIGLPVVFVVYGPLRGALNLNVEAALAGSIFYAALFPSILAKTSTGLLWAFERLDRTALVSVLATILKTAFGAIALLGGFGLVGLAVASLAVNVITAIVLSRLVPALPVGSQPRTNWLRESCPLFVNQLLQGLFFKLDAVLLPGLAGTSAAGTYAAAYKVSEGAGIVSSSFTLALFPRLAGTNHLRSAYRLAVRTLLQLAFPIAAGIALLSEPIVGLIGGRQYLPDSAIALTILIAYLPLSYANGLLQYVLIAAGLQRRLTVAFVAALVFNLAANLVLIPIYGYVGAAWVTVASEVVLLIPFQLAARSSIGGVSLIEEARHAVLATLLMAPVVWWLRDAVHPVAAIVAGMLIYPTALWALGGIDEQQSGLLARMLPDFAAQRAHRVGESGSDHS